MRYVRYLHQGREGCGAVVGQEVRELDWSLRDLLVLAAAGDDEESKLGQGRMLDLDEVELIAPIVPGGRLICVGINYVEHQRESADVFAPDVPEHPIVFIKDAQAICGPFSDLRLPFELSKEFDWEAELGVVIGAPSRGVSRRSAWGVVAGYTVVNDLSVRDVQTRHSQWTLGKNLELATPIGPWVITRDELGSDPQIDVSLRVNGELKQSANTRDLIFDIPTLIEVVSELMPLRPGDVIATGTPAGVGFKRTPPEFLAAGDVVETSIEGVGTLRNLIVAQ